MFEKRKGFTLFEAIITVGIISIASVVILQIFYMASSLSNRAEDLDNGNYILKQNLELSKNAKSYDDFFTDEDLFEYASIEKFESDEILKTALVYYDKDWNMQKEKSDETKFEIKYELIEDVIYEETSSENKGSLYKINSEIIILKKPLFNYETGSLSSDVLTTLSGSKYIGNTKIDKGEW